MAMELSVQITFLSYIMNYYQSQLVDDQIRIIFPDILDGHYLWEWIDTHKKGFQYFWNRLDIENKKKYLLAVDSHYGLHMFH